MNHDPQHHLIVIEGRATYERIQSDLNEMDNDEAIRVLRDFSKVYPDFAQAHNDLGVLYYQSGNSLKALAHYEKAHRLDPSNITYRKNLADFYYIELEWADDAIQTYRSILNDNPFDIETLNALGTISLQTGRRKQARNYFERTLQIDSGNGPACDALLQLGEQRPTAPVQTKLPHFEPRPSPVVSCRPKNQAAQEPPPATSPPVQEQQPSPEQFYGQAVELAQSGQTREACQKLENLIGLYPGYPVAHNDLGVLYQQLGDTSRSRHHHEEAVKLQPDNLVFLKNLADLLFLACGENEEAMRLYIRILGNNPRDVEVLTAVSRICLEVGKFNDACIFLENILAVEPWNNEARECLANVKEHMTKQSDKPALQLSADEMHALAAQHIQQDQLSEAYSLLEELVHHFPEYALAHNDLGVLRYRLMDTDGARRAYERAVELQPLNPVFCKNLADLYFAELGRTDDAIRIYLDLFKRQPRDVETLTALAHISAAVGRPDEAKSFYRRALEIEPWNTEAREAFQKLI